mmetsp:Transcript_64543/g.114346  ORF Transcript_64543/g.114346 Transcript_64543/m.114346 type:complete len:80 (+) Transcript_64543:222-461(+)
MSSLFVERDRFFATTGMSTTGVWTAGTTAARRNRPGVFTAAGNPRVHGKADWDWSPEGGTVVKRRSVAGPGGGAVNAGV